MFEQGFQPRLGDRRAAYFDRHVKYVAWLRPGRRSRSATDTPASPCFNRDNLLVVAATLIDIHALRVRDRWLPSRSLGHHRMVM
jgi:hypothetical protein